MDSDKLVFGPIPSDEIPLVQKEVKRERNDLFLLYGEPTYLGIALSGHEESSMVPEGRESDVIGSVTAGYSVIKNISKDDLIKKIEKKVEITKMIDKISLDMQVTDRMEIFSHIDVDLSESAKNTVESFLAYLKYENNVLKVDDSTHAYTRSENPISIDFPPENNTVPRRRGDVLIRNKGTRRNSIYFYRTDGMPRSSLNNIGMVTNGIELIEVAEPGEKLLIRTNPEQIFVLGMTQSEAEGYLKKRNISQVRDGDGNDDSIIVSQYPRITMDIHDELRTDGIPPDKLIHIEFFEKEAPITVNYVMDITRLYMDYPIGRLRVVASSESLVLMEAEGKKEAIVHENTPNRGEIGVLGITNMSRPNYGLFGVRLEESDEYGPTGEFLESTNIFGKIVKGLDALKGIQTSSRLYFTIV
jgi:putative methanogenesis marker protein 3